MMQKRGFPKAEFQQRVANAQARMAKAGLAALLLTTETEVRYFTGFLTRFWESPSRPWFLIVPASGDPIAVIPAIGGVLMGQSWITDIRTWLSPNPEDEGIGLLSEALREVAENGNVGLPMGPESYLRLPLAEYERLKSLTPCNFVSDQDIVADLRAVKSQAEIAKIKASCDVAARAFAKVPEWAAEGMGLDQVFRQFQSSCLLEGAEFLAYLSGAAEQGGYGDVISPAGPKPLATGDVLMLDTGVVLDGYFCDYDRNYSVGVPSDAVRSAHARLIEASDTAFSCAKPGVTAADLYHAMDGVLTGGQGGGDAGRLGHGLGMQLTEGLSLIPQDQTVLTAGMVITLEPGIEVSAGKVMVHEENVVITETGAEYLSPRMDAEIPRIG